MKNRKGQIAIWVIIALVLVVVIIILFTVKKGPITIAQGQYDVESSIEECVRQATTQYVTLMITQGGFVQPVNYHEYQGINVSYLCQNVGYFKPCIQQHPMLLNEEVEQIQNDTYPIIQQCLYTAEGELEQRGYNVSMSNMNLTVSLGTDRVNSLITTNLSISKNGQTETFQKFNVELVTPLYDLSTVALDISNSEAKYCYFEYVGYMLLYPRWQISLFTFSDSTRIYSIKDKYSNKVMNIAIRGCAIPPGL